MFAPLTGEKYLARGKKVGTIRKGKRKRKPKNKRDNKIRKTNKEREKMFAPLTSKHYLIGKQEVKKREESKKRS